MGDANTAQARLFHTLVKFVAVQHAPEDQLSRNIVESNNHLPNGAITHAKWIKAPEHRKLGQKTAHVIMGFSSWELPKCQRRPLSRRMPSERARLRQMLRQPQDHGMPAHGNPSLRQLSS